MSSNVAPASRTTSVVKNQILAAAFNGASLIPPLFIFNPETSNVLMTYLLLADLQAGHRSLQHPLDLFKSTAVHNGSWTCAYQLRSVLEVVVLAYYARAALPRLTLAAAIAAVLGVAWVRGGRGGISRL